MDDHRTGLAELTEEGVRKRWLASASSSHSWRMGCHLFGWRARTVCPYGRQGAGCGNIGKLGLRALSGSAAQTGDDD